MRWVLLLVILLALGRQVLAQPSLPGDGVFVTPDLYPRPAEREVIQRLGDRLGQVGVLDVSRTVDTMEDLRRLDPDTILGEPKLVRVSGYWAKGGPGGGVYMLTNSLANTNAMGGCVVAVGGVSSWHTLAEPPYDVRLFGFRVDDSSARVDNQVSAQAAVDFSRGAIFFPPGTNHIQIPDIDTPAINIDMSVDWINDRFWAPQVIGEAAGKSVIWFYGGGTGIKISTASGYPVTTTDTSYNINVRGLTIRSADGETNAQTALYAGQAVYGSKFEDLDFWGVRSFDGAALATTQAIGETNGLVTLTTATPHNLRVGQWIGVDGYGTGVSNTLDGVWEVNTIPDPTTVTFYTYHRSAWTNLTSAVAYGARWAVVADQCWNSQWNNILIHYAINRSGLGFFSPNANQLQMRNFTAFGFVTADNSSTNTYTMLLRGFEGALVDINQMAAKTHYGLVLERIQPNSESAETLFQCYGNLEGPAVGIRSRLAPSITDDTSFCSGLNITVSGFANVSTGTGTLNNNTNIQRAVIWLSNTRNSAIYPGYFVSRDYGSFTNPCVWFDSTCRNVNFVGNSRFSHTVSAHWVRDEQPMGTASRGQYAFNGFNAPTELFNINWGAQKNEFSGADYGVTNGIATIGFAEPIPFLAPGDYGVGFGPTAISGPLVILSVGVPGSTNITVAALAGTADIGLTNVGTFNFIKGARVQVSRFPRAGEVWAGYPKAVLVNAYVTFSAVPATYAQTTASAFSYLVGNQLADLQYGGQGLVAGANNVPGWSIPGGSIIPGQRIYQQLVLPVDPDGYVTVLPRVLPLTGWAYNLTVNQTGLLY